MQKKKSTPTKKASKPQDNTKYQSAEFIEDSDEEVQ